ncbi:MAG: NAD(P)-dependent oxidoreductase [Alphaproteobacteria bacterium]|nr:NAD(P)-dependent oxidoreductase [Alphaproteobacteria bacterium]
MKRKVLVVGGAGYIGSVLIPDLLERGYAVRCVDLLLYGNQGCVLPWIRHPDFEFQRGDIADPKAVESALAGITDVVLLAGLVGDPITKKYPEASTRINLDAQLALLKAANGRGLDRLVFVSTCSNYGLQEGDRLSDETTELRPLSLYAKHKVAVEQALLAGRGTVDFRPTVLRFATAFGLSPRMRFDLTVSEFTRDMALGRPLLVYDAHTWRPYCHVRDFAEVIARVLAAPVEKVAFEVFNAGGDINNATKQTIVDTILRRLPGSKVDYKAQGSDPRNYRVSFAKIRERLGFAPRFTVEDGVDELIGAIRQGLFDDADARPNFFANREIAYST